MLKLLELLMLRMLSHGMNQDDRNVRYRSSRMIKCSALTLVALLDDDGGGGGCMLRLFAAYGRRSQADGERKFESAYVRAEGVCCCFGSE